MAEWLKAPALKAGVRMHREFESHFILRLVFNKILFEEDYA